MAIVLAGEYSRSLARMQHVNMHAHQTAQPAKRGSPVAVVFIAGLVVVVLVTGMVLYFYRDILRDANQRSTIGGCINDVFRVSSDTASLVKWDDGKLQLPTMEARSTIKSELPEDLSQFSFLAAACCSEGGQDISTCADALRGFVETHPEATEFVGDDAAPIKEFAAGGDKLPIVNATEEEGAAPDSAEAAIAAVIAEPSEAKRITAAFRLMTSEDEGVGAAATRAFYESKYPALRRAAIIRALEQTESGNRKLLVEASVPDTAETASETTKQELQRRVTSFAGKSLSRVKIDRGTGAFSATFTGYGRCDGTVTDDEVTIFASGWVMKLKPEPASPVLKGTYTRGGQALSLRIRLIM